MRRLSMVIIGLTLAATAASAEPLRLGDMDLDLVTADMLGSSLVPRVAQSHDRGSFDEDANAGVAVTFNSIAYDVHTGHIAITV